MNIPLKKRYADWIAEQVSAGRYASEIEAIEDAVAARIRADDAEFLRGRLRESERQAERGEVVPADDAFFESLRERVRQVARRSP